MAALKCPKCGAEIEVKTISKLRLIKVVEAKDRAPKKKSKAK